MSLAKGRDVPQKYVKSGFVWGGGGEELLSFLTTFRKFLTLQYMYMHSFDKNKEKIWV